MARGCFPKHPLEISVFHAFRRYNMSVDKADFEQPTSESSPGWYGVYPAFVIDNKDPEAQGRLKIMFEGREIWARLATLMAGDNRGSRFIPDIKDEVLVAFEGGDPRRPYVVGALWNGRDRPPESMDGDNDRKVLQSRNGVKITLDDQDGQEKFIVETPGAQKIIMQDGPGSIVIEDRNGNSIKLESAGLTVTAPGKLTIKSSIIELGAGMVTVNAGTSKFSGVIQCDTLISNSVISSSYSPGAGNIW
jgi:uncharacterized protein involved in type VI secretion and phage assembly